ncbi:hypothetical protein B0A48_16117 [Cryoendolithus antarcticus]|uniref:DUF1746 domain-containing protein n=1 Tax=Cryoendolithus antarcticus TaxID=1507870 RepID=A0A1V8SF82_9PEZI|nr:hypothetical protein B0A48_16117 [Cryoendolithus antarcticus]
MNDEAAPEASSSRLHAGSDGATPEANTLTPTQLKERQKANRQTFNRKRGSLLEDLINQLDILVYAELSCIYYMDCSFLRFIFRAMVHFTLLSPKPSAYPRPFEPQPYAAGVLIPNVLCMLLHLWLHAPSAGEATRGVLQGGLIMDFIGQQGPSSKVMLLLLDLLVLWLQLVQLSAHLSREKLRNAPSGVTAARAVTAVPSAQDLDSEERGVRRSLETDEQTGIELQSLNPSGRTLDPESEPLVAAAADAPQADAIIFDAFYSGQIILGDFDIWTTAVEQWKHYRKASPEVAGSYRAQLAGRVAGLRIALGALRGLT